MDGVSARCSHLENVTRPGRSRAPRPSLLTRCPQNLRKLHHPWKPDVTGTEVWEVPPSRDQKFVLFSSFLKSFSAGQTWRVWCRHTQRGRLPTRRQRGPQAVRVGSRHRKLTLTNCPPAFPKMARARISHTYIIRLGIPKCVNLGILIAP